MRRRLPILSPLILLALVGAATAGIIDPIEERIQCVFPFEVGQEYQFKAGGDVTLPNWEVLPGGQVAEVTITDTIIAGETWLKIPYWNMFGTGYYRLDGTMILQLIRSSSGEVVGGQHAIDLEWGNWSTFDRDAYGPTWSMYWTLFGQGPDVHMQGIFGWADPPENAPVTDPVLHVRYSANLNPWGVDAFYGAYGPGSCLHATGYDSVVSLSPTTFGYRQAHVWGLFRPKSTEPWPEFADWAVTDARTAEQLDSESGVTACVAYPNPFNPSVSINYTVPEWGNVSVVVYDVLGRRVRELRSGPHDVGDYVLTWDGRNDLGTKVGSGVYLLTVTTSEKRVAIRATLVR